MTKWLALCSSDDVGRQPVRHTLRDDTDIVLIRHAGRLLAMSNRCPHKDASLHRSGDIEDLGGDLGLCLRCPKHKGKFGGGLYVSFTTGKCATKSPCSRSGKVAKWTVPVYETKEEGGVVFIRQAAEHGPVRNVGLPTAVTTEHGAHLAAQVVVIRPVSPDSSIFVLRLLNDQDRAAFMREPSAMWHIWLAVGGVSREYTPISSSLDSAKTGTIELVIKVYAQGLMSEQLANLTAGDVVAVSEPRVTLRVPDLETASPPAGLSFNLLAGGTGIAPCLQMLRKAMGARATVRMLYSIRTQNDALLESELKGLAAAWPNCSFSYALILTRASESPAGAEREPKRSRRAGAVCGRRIDAAIVREHLAAPAVSDEGARPGAVMTIITGPSGFNACCEDLVGRTLAPAESGEVVVLDA
ncbi:CBR1 [Symbiodinium sp. KB8]|nr:CBR1 [Symbiodinium sp. KB8]